MTGIICDYHRGKQASEKVGLLPKQSAWEWNSGLLVQSGSSHCIASSNPAAVLPDLLTPHARNLLPFLPTACFFLERQAHQWLCPHLVTPLLNPSVYKVYIRQAMPAKFPRHCLSTRRSSAISVLSPIPLSQISYRTQDQFKGRDRCPKKETYAQRKRPSFLTSYP